MLQSKWRAGLAITNKFNAQFQNEVFYSPGSMSDKMNFSIGTNSINGPDYPVGIGSVGADLKVKREAGKRIFVNRNLLMEKVKFFGFDMDYTLAVYKSPHYEQLGFQLTIDRLISIGYPAELRNFSFDHTFPVRGLWFDNFYGNLLKVDAYGNILVGIHGFTFLKPYEIEEMYPNKFVQFSENRIFVLNTLFNLPEEYILACLVNYFDTLTGAVREKNGVAYAEVFMSYKSIFQDVRSAVDWVHTHGDVKKLTIRDMEKFIHKDERLPILLDRMRSRGSKTFLLTNSEYWYTNEVMKYLLESEKRSWLSYFDFINVDAMKPLWFSEGTVYRQIDYKTGEKKLGVHTGPFLSNQIYAGGSCAEFSRIVGCRGKDVVYVGDHIFGDVLKSKKGRGWRTFLVVPELAHELHVWTDRRSLFERLQQLEVSMASAFKNLDSSSASVNNAAVKKIRHGISDLTHEMDMAYGVLGSLFRSGSRQTFFASQVERYADIYSSTCLNLLNYPFFYFFRAPPMLMPHESTVKHDDRSVIDAYADRSRSLSTVGALTGGFCGGASSANGSPLPSTAVRAPLAVIPDSHLEDALPVPTDGSPVSAERHTRVTTPVRSTFVHEEQEEEDAGVSSSGGSQLSRQTSDSSGGAVRTPRSSISSVGEGVRVASRESKPAAAFFAAAPDQEELVDSMTTAADNVVVDRAVAAAAAGTPENVSNTQNFSRD